MIPICNRYICSQPCDFTQVIDNSPPRNPSERITVQETTEDYARRELEYRRMQHLRRLTTQQLPEREIGIKLNEDDLQRRRQARREARRQARRGNR